MHGPQNFAFIDGVNLHLTYENIDWKLDYAKLRNFLKHKFNVTVAYYFIGKKFGDNDPENSGLYKQLESDGYDIKYKNPSKYVTEEEYCPYCWLSIAPEIVRYKADCDSFMTLEVISNLSLFDKAVIITSDGDFDELVNELIRKDKLRLVFAPCKKGCSGLLVSAARGRIDFIDEHKAELEKN